MKHTNKLITHPCSSVSICGSKKGTILVLVMIITAMIAAMAMAYLATTTTQNTHLQGNIDYDTARQTCKSGMEMSKISLVTGHDTAATPWTWNNTVAGQSGWDDELQACSTNASYTPTSIEDGAVIANFKWAVPFNYHGTYYKAILTDNDDGDSNLLNDNDDTVILTAYASDPGATDYAFGRYQSQMQVLVRYRRELYAPDSAIVTGGALKMWGSSTVEGDQGIIYATGQVDISGCSGDPAVSQGIYTPGIILGDEKVGGAGAHEGASAPEVPSVNPSEYFDLADFDLWENGEVYSKVDGAWVLLGTADGSTAVAGWKYDIGTKTWSNSGEPDSGTVYVQNGNVELTGNIGGSDKAWVGTLLVNGTGTADGTGNVTLAGTGNTIMTPDSGGIAVMTMGNISGSGNMTVDNGLVAAHEQITISGNMDVTGSLLAESYTYGAYGLAVTGFGSAKVTYNGGLTTILRDGDPYIKIMCLKIVQ